MSAIKRNIGEHFQRPGFMPALLMLPRQIQGSVRHGARFIYAAAQQISFAQPYRAERQESDSSGSSQTLDTVFQVMYRLGRSTGVGQSGAQPRSSERHVDGNIRGTADS